jgi:hypothetical protein
MTDRLLTALERLESALTSHGWPSVRGLQPGLTETEVRERLIDHDFEPPEELITRFGWHDGYLQPLDQIPGWQGGWIGSLASAYSLEQATKQYLFVMDSIDELDVDPEPRWFPVFSWLNGDIVLNCGNHPETRGTVALFWPGPDEGFDSTYRPRSLAEPVEWWAGWVETGRSYCGPSPSGSGAPAVLSALTIDQLTPNQLASRMYDVR